MSKFGEWIPVKFREAYEEEKQAYGYTHIAMCELPDDCEEVLISFNNGTWIDLVEFDAEHIADSKGYDWTYEVDAWMPLPEGYKKENEE